MSLGIFTGFVLAYVLQPSELSQAFAIGAGWEVLLSSMTKETNTTSVSDGRVLRTLKWEELPKIEESLQVAESIMEKIGVKDRLPIVDDKGRLMGLITDGMIKRVKEKIKDISKVKLSEIMIGATEVVKVDEKDNVNSCYSRHCRICTQCCQPSAGS